MIQAKLVAKSSPAFTQSKAQHLGNIMHTEFRACLHEWVIFSRFLMQGMNPAHSFINLIFSKNFISYPKVVRKEEGSCTYSLRPVGILQLQVGLRHPPPPSPTQLPNLLIIFPCAGHFPQCRNSYLVRLVPMFPSHREPRTASLNFS